MFRRIHFCFLVLISIMVCGAFYFVKEQKNVMDNGSIEKIQTLNECSSITNKQKNDKDIMNDERILTINDKNFFHLDFDGTCYELPILLISRELGAQVEWKSSNCVLISYDGNSIELDISKQDFSLTVPPGGYDGIRKIANGEIFLDYASAIGIVKHLLKAEIYDYGDSIKIWR